MRTARLFFLVACLALVAGCTGIAPDAPDAITVASTLPRAELYSRVGSALAAEGWGVASSDAALGLVTTTDRPEGGATLRLSVNVEATGTGSTATIRGQMTALGASTPVREAGASSSPMRRAWQAMERVADRLR